MVCSTPGMSEQSLKLSTNNLFVVRSRSVRAAVGDGRKMIEAHKGNNSKRECHNTPLRHHLALADTHFDLSLSRDSYFGRNLYSCYTPSLLSRQKPVELSNRSAVRTMCEIIIYAITRSVNRIIELFKNMNNLL